MTRTLWVLSVISVLSCTDYRIHLDEDAGGGDGGSDGGIDAGLLPDAGDESDFTGEVCASVGRQVTLVPLDLLVLLDVSGSMDYDLKWVAVKSALKSFVSRSISPASVSGSSTFPRGPSAASTPTRHPRCPSASCLARVRPF